MSIFNRAVKRSHVEEFTTTRTDPVEGVSYYLPYGLFDANCDTSFCAGGRRAGKSTGLCTQGMIARAINENKAFIFCQNEKDQVTQAKLKKYFGAVRFGDIEGLPAGTYQIDVTRNKEIFLDSLDDNGDVVAHRYVGFAVCVERAYSYKSETILSSMEHDIMYIEEMGNISGDIDLYWDRYKHLISTFERFVSRFRVISITNKVDRNNVFFVKYKLPPPDKKFPIDKIRVYEILSDPPLYDAQGNQLFSRVAVENVENRGAKSNVLIGAGLQTGIADDDFEEKEYAQITDKRNRDIAYRMYMIEDTIKFLMLCVVNKKGHVYWEVYHTDKDIPADARVITNYVTTNPLHTQGIIPLSAGEKKIFQILLNGKVFYASNLCGTEFNRILERIN